MPGGAGAAAVETRRLLSLVRYLHLATVGLLEDLHSRSPWRALITLVACVGPCLTAASRADEVSHVQDFAALFRARAGDWMRVDPFDCWARGVADELIDIVQEGSQHVHRFDIVNDTESGQRGHHWISIALEMQWVG
jgi:hypothetical protein